jgi:hypothetical protein
MHSSKKRANKTGEVESASGGSREREWKTTTMTTTTNVHGKGEGMKELGVKIQQWVGVTRRQQKTIDRKEEDRGGCGIETDKRTERDMTQNGLLGT